MKCWFFKLESTEWLVFFSKYLVDSETEVCLETSQEMNLAGIIHQSSDRRTCVTLLESLGCLVLIIEISALNHLNSLYLGVTIWLFFRRLPWILWITWITWITWTAGTIKTTAGLPWIYWISCIASTSPCSACMIHLNCLNHSVA